MQVQHDLNLCSLVFRGFSLVLIRFIFDFNWILDGV